MKYRIVQSVEDAMISTEPLDLEAWCAVAGVEITGVLKQKNPGRIPLRPELVGQPILAGFAGPCWGGMKDGEPVIRYEDAESYRALSI